MKMVKVFKDQLVANKKKIKELLKKILKREEKLKKR
jgi:hypothetical protein